MNCGHPSAKILQTPSRLHHIQGRSPGQGKRHWICQCQDESPSSLSARRLMCRRAVRERSSLGFWCDLTRGKESERQRLGSCRTGCHPLGRRSLFGAKWTGCPDCIRPDLTGEAPLACWHGFFRPCVVFVRAIDGSRPIPLLISIAKHEHDGWLGKGGCVVRRVVVLRDSPSPYYYTTSVFCLERFA